MDDGSDERETSSERRSEAELAALIQDASRGDTAAFDALVRRYYGRLYALAFRLLGNPEDAEDTAQDCFVKAASGLSWYRGGSFEGWLRRILVHLVRDRFRRRGRRPEVATMSEEHAPLERRRPEDALGQRELNLVLSEALARLPDNLRIPLILRTREGASYDDIARDTGVTAATARTQVMKARRALVRMLARYLPDELGELGEGGAS